MVRVDVIGIRTGAEGRGGEDAANNDESGGIVGSDFVKLRADVLSQCQCTHQADDEFPRQLGHE